MKIVEYLGHFHPLLVHLPIGILTLVFLLILIIPRSRFENQQELLKLMLLINAISATFSAVTGLFLISDGSYSGIVLDFHRALGFIITAISWVLYFSTNMLLKTGMTTYRAVFTFAVLVLILTGHAGGSLTHGSDFLSPPPFSAWFGDNSASLQSFDMDSEAYEVAATIMQQKCVSCHGANKQRGELKLDSREALLQGGENGIVLLRNDGSSELIERMLLPLEHEDHMPPEERKQLTKDEMDFLMWWVKHDLELQGSLSKLNFPDSLLGLFDRDEMTAVNSLVPEEEIELATTAAVGQLRDLGVILIPVGTNSNYLSASFVNVGAADFSNAMQALKMVSDQLVWLNLDYQELDSAAWSSLAALQSLRKLSLKNAKFEPENIANLSSLVELRHLNLVNTQISVNELQALEALKSLEQLFLFATSVDPAQENEVQSLFPFGKIELGNYTVPILPSDTTIYKGEDNG